MLAAKEIRIERLGMFTLIDGVKLIKLETLVDDLLNNILKISVLVVIAFLKKIKRHQMISIYNYYHLKEITHL